MLSEMSIGLELGTLFSDVLGYPALPCLMLDSRWFSAPPFGGKYQAKGKLGGTF
jgi:hypothetical protein